MVMGKCHCVTPSHANISLLKWATVNPLASHMSHVLNAATTKYILQNSSKYAVQWHHHMRKNLTEIPFYEKNL